MGDEEEQVSIFSEDQQKHMLYVPSCKTVRRSIS